MVELEFNNQAGAVGHLMNNIDIDIGAGRSARFAIGLGRIIVQGEEHYQRLGIRRIRAEERRTQMVFVTLPARIVPLVIPIRWQAHLHRCRSKRRPS